MEAGPGSGVGVGRRLAVPQQNHIRSRVPPLPGPLVVATGDRHVLATAVHPTMSDEKADTLASTHYYERSEDRPPGDDLLCLASRVVSSIGGVGG